MPCSEEMDSACGSPAPVGDPLTIARTQLRGTRWGLDLLPIGKGGESAAAEHDTVAFEGEQIVSERFAAAGYPPATYTLAVSKGSGLVWEAMQIKPNEGVVFWHGEISGSQMRGAFSRYPMTGDAEDFSFSGHELGGAFIGSAEQSAQGEGDTVHVNVPDSAAVRVGVSAEPVVGAPKQEPQPGAGQQQKKKRKWRLF